MKRLIVSAAACLCLVAAAQTSDADGLQPIPAPAGSPFGMEIGTPVEAPIHYDTAPAPLFQCVKYVDKHEMHPCAVPKIIRVNNPCADDGCCEPQCVYIQICVPPCGCETVKCRRRGNRVRYDYGKYAVDVRVKKNRIVVDYQD